MERTPDVVVIQAYESKEKGDDAKFIHSHTMNNQKPISSSSENKNNKKNTTNSEAHILEADVVRAGGFGARDDISNFLPVASDSTDFEATIRDAREYEDEPEHEMLRPGLGWTETTETK